MIVDNLYDIIESYGFKWNGKMWTLGFYRIRESNLYFVLEKFLGYEWRYKIVVPGGAVYETYAIMFASSVINSWIERDIMVDTFNNFKNKMLTASRDAKLKRIDGYYKRSEEYYSNLHSEN